MTELYNQISEFLTGIGFEAPNEEHESFRMKVLIPGRTIIINGQRTQEPSKETFLDITPIGEGAILDIDNVPMEELQGFDLGGADVWVDSLDDFKFWFEKAIGVIPEKKLK